MKYFQGLPKNGHMLTKTVIILPLGVLVGPISTQTPRGERVNPKKTPRLHQEARSTLKFSLKRDFLALKVKEHYSSMFVRQVLNPLALPFEGNSRDYVSYRH